MKENNKNIVLYSAERDGFLGEYKDQGTLAFEAGFSKKIRDALYMPIDSYEGQKDVLDKLAEAFGCEVLIVEAEYNVTKLDGSDFERTEREPTFEDGFKALMEAFAK